MIQANFKLNAEKISRLHLFANQYRAFSGDGRYRNIPTQITLPKSGAIPVGTYYLVDWVPSGDAGKTRDDSNQSNPCFALYKKDTHLDDAMFSHAVKRGMYRLRPKLGSGISDCCIVINRLSDYATISHLIRNSPKYPIPNSKYLSYGIITVS